jgi:hypothetical protein
MQEGGVFFRFRLDERGEENETVGLTCVSTMSALCRRHEEENEEIASKAKVPMKQAAMFLVWVCSVHS